MTMSSEGKRLGRGCPSEGRLSPNCSGTWSSLTARAPSGPRAPAVRRAGRGEPRAPPRGRRASTAAPSARPCGRGARGPRRTPGCAARRPARRGAPRAPRTGWPRWASRRQRSWPWGTRPRRPPPRRARRCAGPRASRTCRRCGCSRRARPTRRPPPRRARSRRAAPRSWGGPWRPAPGASAPAPSALRPSPRACTRASARSRSRRCSCGRAPRS
mmetsp:Transcript_9841/g.26260  ORF Transcript_9841/g.26260 Transcript_9841/m.26260 type:complete len:215 (+) Transcript_9841:95-739(+)